LKAGCGAILKQNNKTDEGQDFLSLCGRGNFKISGFAAINLL
jgi:hypothetical protein